MRSPASGFGAFSAQRHTGNGSALDRTPDDFSVRYNDHQGEIAEFWNKLKDHPDFATEGLVSQIQFSLQLAVLTGGSALLVKSLRDDGRLKSTRDLIDIDLPAWRDRISATVGKNGDGLPPNIKGTTVEEKIGNYAGYIIETLKSAFPTAFVRKGMAQAPAIDTALVKRLLELNPTLDPKGPLPDKLNWGDLPDGDRAKASAALGHSGPS